MLVTALDDLHMIKFKSGWFTMIKYDEKYLAQDEKIKKQIEANPDFDP